jgi:crotonobetainyl-CoA:carnitine CoA-transferase CaiB-like acyl-CoA transferase
MPFRFLAGTRVLDLSQYVPGPYATLLLADLGADVVKVEPPGGDPMRGLAGPRDADGISPFWKLMNGGKTIVELDLKARAGADALRRLVARADVLLESYRPGVLDRLGFGAAALAALDPALIHASLTGYGATGPWAQRSGHDINYMATMGGLGSSGVAARPVAAFPPTADYASGMQAALAICAALAGRARDGRGTRLDLSLAETVLAWQGMNLALAARGVPTDRERSLLNGGAAFYRAYACADGRFVTLGAIEPKFWANFCAAVGRDDWIARQGDALPQTALIAELDALFARRDADAWEALLGPADCCFAVVLRPDEVAGHPQVAARGLVREVDGRVEPGFPAWIDGAPPAPRPPARIVATSEALARWA